MNRLLIANNASRDITIKIQFKVKHPFALLIIQMSVFLMACGDDPVTNPSDTGEILSIRASVQEGPRPLTVDFTISSTAIEASDVFISFGDGFTQRISSQSTVSHTFTEADTYNVFIAAGSFSEEEFFSSFENGSFESGLFTDSVEITVLGDINLIVSSFAIDRTINVTDPSNIETVSAIIQNIGSDALTKRGDNAISIEVGYYLSTDDVITVDDILIGDTSVLVGVVAEGISTAGNGLATGSLTQDSSSNSFSQNQVPFGFEKLGPGENYQFNHQLAVKRNIPTGTYYAGAIVDYIDYYDWYDFPRATNTLEYLFPEFVSFAESNEDDNSRTLGAYQVTVNNTTCASDQFEDDDSSDQATTITVGSSQAHNFCFDNSDWVKFDAVAGSVYKISTDSLGVETDTQLILYDRDGSSILLFDDNLGIRFEEKPYEKFTVDLAVDFPSDPRSEIVWEAEFSGTYFIKIRTTTCDSDRDAYCSGTPDNIIDSPDGVGLNTEYTISLQ